MIKNLPGNAETGMLCSDPGTGNMPPEEEMALTPVFLPGKSQGDGGT